MGAKRFGSQTEHVNFEFGPKFLPTAQSCGGIDGALKSIVMDHITKLVFKPDDVEFSEFRNTKAKSSGVRVRKSDNAKAYRMHLTGRHEGFRLMFWWHVDGTIEIANIGPKFEEKIL
ncbi:hypothetical protein ROE7235_03946 [Roseibaca ekhonensis]|uniref:Toxin HigB-2 n=1 Tax=Roseinatronobacter ekhonensis TaxID=254356 RepID=A0A3B0MEX3_9RHOB|nr:hypothetical protein ROE7235_03946 [Roseibaca ekhonensis]